MQPVQVPDRLNPGDEIRIVSPASVVEEDYINNTVRAISELGYKVKLGNHVFHSRHQYAGSDMQRLSDFQEAVDDKNVKAVFCARGGYGSMRIVDKINFNHFSKHPKWIVGFSDITVFHSLLNCHFNCASIHSPMPVNFNSPFFRSNLSALDEMLKGQLPEITFPADPLNRFGSAEGKLVGGNLSILIHLQGTPFEVFTENAILFLEDVGEQLYHLDRMMQSLLLSGKLGKLNGLMVGGLTDMSDKKRPFGKTPGEIVYDAVKDFNYPVGFGFPAGHMENNRPFILGTKVKLNIGSADSSIQYI